MSTNHTSLLSDENEKERPFNNKKRAGIIASAAILVMGMLILGIIIYTRSRNLRRNDNYESRKEDLELPVFDLTTIAHATNNFSSSNKLGEGGFGPVYKVTIFR